MLYARCALRLIDLRQCLVVDAHFKYMYQNESFVVEPRGAKGGMRKDCTLKDCALKLEHVIVFDGGQRQWQGIVF